MAMYRVYAGPDGESHIEELPATRQAELTSFDNIVEAGINHYAEMRSMDFHPLAERRLIIHLAGEVEIGLRRRLEAGLSSRGRQVDGGRNRPGTYPQGPIANHGVSRPPEGLTT